ncbi:hypothetical protein M378DRAFT_178487 [Amanita muscaria Koide BX008]|uniref:Uncharacterized protein n=1 Tax=Amanita muscaria (strain Koide BX008) TaxID=946122 RepID=A0A0C2TE59_AMAMK|nr:hypothetical protein M378DRAFT_178487 [Amanita muscaria Koide BX008]
MAKGRYGAQLVYTPMINTKPHPINSTLQEKKAILFDTRYCQISRLPHGGKYAKMLERAGAQILTLSWSNTRATGSQYNADPHIQGLADWTKIRAVKEAVSVPTSQTNAQLLVSLQQVQTAF